MAIEWFVLEEAFKIGKKFADISDKITQEDTIKALDVISNASAQSAADFLREARERHGDARRRKLEAALPLLRLACRARAEPLGGGIRWAIYRFRHPRRTLSAAGDYCRLAVITAATYHALGDDRKSVEFHLSEAIAMCDLRTVLLKRIMLVPESFMLVGKADGGRHLPSEHIPGALVAEIQRNIRMSEAAHKQLQVILEAISER